MTGLNIFRFHDDGLVSLFMSLQTSDIGCIILVAMTTMHLRYFRLTHTFAILTIPQPALVRSELLTL